MAPVQFAPLPVSVELVGTIRSRNRDFSAGDLDSGKRRYLVRTIGRFATTEAFETLIVKRKGDAIVRLGEIATIQLGHFEIRSKSYAAGEPSILLAFRRETGSNVIDVRNAALPEIERLREEVIEPAGMRILMVTDDVLYVEDSVANVWKNLTIGAFLATAVMFLFMRSPILTFVGMMGIPICTISAFIGLLLMDRTINVISLAGIAFAIGMTLDNTIVVLENIDQERSKGRNPFEAAVKGATAVWPAVLASTLTTAFVFAPVLFVQEEAGQLYSDIAIAISAAILMSMLFAITVVPTATARLPEAKHSEGQRVPWAPFRKPILSGIQWLIRTPVRSVGCMLVILGLTGAAILFLVPPAEYLPEGSYLSVLWCRFKKPWLQMPSDV